MGDLCMVYVERPAKPSQSAMNFPICEYLGLSRHSNN